MSVLCPILRPVLRPVFRGLEPDCEHYPVVIQPGGEPLLLQCGTDRSSGDVGFPITYEIELGTAVGTVEVHWNVISNADKFIVTYDGVEVVNTGYVGPAGQQPDLDERLAYHGLPSEPLVTSSGAGHTDFVKYTATPTTALITVYAPGPPGSSLWNFNVNCPDGIIPV